MLVLWHLWIGRARKSGPGPQHVAVEVFNVGAGLRMETWLLRPKLIILLLLGIV